MSWIYDRDRKCYIFKGGGLVPKCLLGDVLQKGWAYVFNGQDGTFNLAFRNARKEGQKYFRWNGSLYNTNMKPNPPAKAVTPLLDITHKFKSRNFDEFVSVMYPIFEASFKKYNLPMTLMLNVLRQAAYESGYGTNPRGARGYNLGGIKWFDDPNSNSYKYKHTTHTDGKEYIDFDNLLDYADYKINLLHNTYNALNATNTNDFVLRLHPGGSYNYSTNSDGYKQTLNNMKSLDRAYEKYVANRK